MKKFLRWKEVWASFLAALMALVWMAHLGTLYLTDFVRFKMILMFLIVTYSLLRITYIINQEKNNGTTE